MLSFSSVQMIWSNWNSNSHSRRGDYARAEIQERRITLGALCKAFLHCNLKNMRGEKEHKRNNFYRDNIFLELSSFLLLFFTPHVLSFLLILFSLLTEKQPLSIIRAGLLTFLLLKKHFSSFPKAVFLFIVFWVNSSFLSAL
jgi:hypothetical protein